MKTIFITGASSGIGRAAVYKFQAAGWQVAATMRTPSRETEFQKLENVRIYELDVTKSEMIEKTVAAAIADFGGIDVLLNNAGYGLAGSLEAATLQQLEHQYATNVFGPIQCIQNCLPQMRKQGSGLIINITSIGGRLALPFNSLYHGTKYAMEGISESLAVELAEQKIVVKIVEPGGVLTDFSGRSLVLTQKEGLNVYDAALQRAIVAFSDPNRANLYSAPEQIADVIYEAATDGKDQLRYVAGKDAHMMWGDRQDMTDEEYRKWLIKHYNI